jgi:hypothetical protein
VTAALLQGSGAPPNNLREAIASGSAPPELVALVQRSVRARAGVSKQAIQDAMEVAFLFNIYDRLADAMGWDVPPLAGGYYQVAARRLLKHEYV